MLARVGSSLSLPIECNRHSWSILFSTRLSSSASSNHFLKYMHTKAKTKPQSTQTHTKPRPKSTSEATISQQVKPATQPTQPKEPTSKKKQEASDGHPTQHKLSITPNHPSTKDTPSLSTTSTPATTSTLSTSTTSIPSTTYQPTTTPQQPSSVEEVEDDEGLVRYRPSPSVPPKRVPFNAFLTRAKANKVSIVDVAADTPRKEFFEVLKYLPGKTSLRDLTVRIKDINVAQAALLSKVLQTCENLQSFRIFSADFYGPAGVQALHTLTKGVLNSENLDNLSLENCKISTLGWDVIAEWMHKTTKLRTVDLKRTRMTGTNALLTAIKTNQNASQSSCFEKLDWAQNMTSDETVATVLQDLADVAGIQNIRIKNYDVYRHNWNHTLLQVASKNDEKRDQVRAEIERHKDALKEEFVPKPISTFHSNENEYINPRDKDRLQRKEKETKIIQAYEQFDYLKGATDREILKRIKLLKKRTQSKRGAVVKLR